MDFDMFMRRFSPSIAPLLSQVHHNLTTCQYTRRQDPPKNPETRQSILRFLSLEILQMGSRIFYYWIL